MTPEVNQKIAALRNLSRQRPLTKEELREAIQLMREGRVGAARASEGSRAKKSAAKMGIDSDSLLDDLLA